MCHKEYEHGEPSWNSKDPRSNNDEGIPHEYKSFFEICPNLKLFLKEHAEGEPDRESIEKELRIALNDLNIDMKVISDLEEKQSRGILLDAEEQRTITIARADQLKIQEKITWLNQVLTEYDSFEDFKNTLES